MIFRIVITFLAVACWAGNAQADIQFHCPEQLAELQQGLTGYLQALDIPDNQVAQNMDANSGDITLALTTPQEDTHTLDLFMRPEFALSLERVRLPAIKNNMRVVRTVSKKEIMLALLQHGRLTTFKDKACSIEALSDHVGVRQNIVAWAEKLNMVWPNGGPAKWNKKYWTRGTPNPGVSLHAAVMDVFLHQKKYAVGCYTATKLVVIQGTLDYYTRIKHDQERTRRVEEALLADGDPLVGIEPRSMWSFEKDFDISEINRKGKLLKIYNSVAAGNFVPGDWGYLLNTDPATEQKTGYEGSNAIYLGRNRFDDYYNDNQHSYTYEQKLDEVYQWRNGVFSRSRDAKKIKPLTAEALALLGGSPAAGGIQMDFRVVPKYF